MELQEFCEDFAAALTRVDGRRPQAANQRTGHLFQPGIGPHPESATVELIIAELASSDPGRYANHALSVPYPTASRQKCDVCIGSAPEWEWSLEVKLIRMLGDNGKPNDNLPTHVLSPYPAHRSALTDCDKLMNSGFPNRKAIVFIGYDSAEYPVISLVEAFQALARLRVGLSHMASAPFGELIHPVHRNGLVVAWELSPPR